MVWFHLQEQQAASIAQQELNLSFVVHCSTFDLASAHKKKLIKAMTTLIILLSDIIMSAGYVLL